MQSYYYDSDTEDFINTYMKNNKKEKVGDL